MTTLDSPAPFHRALESTPERDDAVRALVDIVDPSWQADLRDGIEDALQLLTPGLLTNPTIRDGIDTLVDGAPAFSELLGDPDRRPAVRRWLLDYMRGFLGVTTLAAAADRGERLPDWQAAAVIPAWRASIRQLQRVLDVHEFATMDDPAPATTNPMASVLTSYQCRNGRCLAPYFQRDPELAAFLLATREQLSHFFPDASTERIWLAPGHDPDGSEDLPGLEITVFTRQDPDTARRALECFDAKWWLDHCDYPTRIIIDTHLV